MENKQNDKITRPPKMSPYKGKKETKQEIVTFEYIEDTDEDFGVDYHPFLDLPLIEDEESDHV